MPGRYALIVSQDAAGLADFLEEDGGFEVQTTVNPNEVAAFAAAREAADVVLVAIDGDPRATVSALEACASTHVLVIAENEIAAEPAKGRAFLTGAPLRVVGRELRSGRADKDKDGEVLVRELYQRLRQNHQPRLRSSLDTAFVVARNPQRVDARERIRRQRNRDGQGFTRGGRQRPLVAAGACSRSPPCHSRGCTAAAASISPSRPGRRGRTGSHRWPAWPWRSSPSRSCCAG